MKAFRAVTILFLCFGYLFNTTSCLVVKHDNGKHKGWYKNSNNPHHPNTINLGKSKGKK